MSAVVIEADFVQWLRDNQALAQRGAWPRYMAVFMDPPYGLEFMGQEWDKPKPSDANIEPFSENEAGGLGGYKTHVRYGTGVTAMLHYQAWVTEWATLLLDYVDPGALLVAFGGSRTYHRLACGIEDAGWEIADSMRVALPAAWVQGQGFPKGHRHSRDFQIMRRGWTGAAISNQAMLDLSLDYRRRMWREEKRWEGWNVALSPAYEALVIARAPRGNHTYASLALTYGTGALAIDAGRVQYRNAEDFKSAHGGDVGSEKRGDFLNKLKARPQSENITPLGRWPANFALVHDERCTDAACVDGCPVKALGEQSGERRSAYVNESSAIKNAGKDAKAGEIFTSFGTKSGMSYTDAGSAARFFYCAKAGGFERFYPDADGNWQRIPHPTVKPLELTAHIATLLKPPTERSRILIPFSGVASEMIGCLLAGWTDITGIEQSAEYAAIARARLKWWSQFDSYDAAKARYDSEQRGRADDATKEAAGQLRLFDEAEEKSA